VPTLEQTFAWLIQLPSMALYAAAFGFSALENIFPPFPADALVALAAFVANPGEASLITTYLAVVVGNVAGAAVTYVAGRRYGAQALHARLNPKGVKREARLERLYLRYGTAAIFLGRLIPGVRALVPPFAGAMKLRAGTTLATIAFASAIWYGLITWLAFTAGADWRQYVDEITKVGQWGAGIAVGIVVVVGGLAFWFLRRRRTEA
jgi:membrane protein DedA with SNARE-associated domain